MANDPFIVDRVAAAVTAADNALQPPPDLKEMLAHKAAIDQQLSHTPAGHPDFAKLQTQQSTLATAIASHPKNSGK